MSRAAVWSKVSVLESTSQEEEVVPLEAELGSIGLRHVLVDSRSKLLSHLRRNGSQPLDDLPYVLVRHATVDVVEPVLEPMAWHRLVE